MHTMSVESLENDIGELMKNTSEVLLPHPPARLFRMLQHFHTVTCLTLGGSTVQRVMHDYIVPTALQEPYLIHMVLAVAFGHLKHLESVSTESSQCHAYALAQAMHWQNGLELYRAALSNVAQPGKHKGDAIIGTTFLAVICAHIMEDEVWFEEFVSNYDRAVTRILSPLAVSSGVKALNNTAGLFDSTVAFRSVLLEADDSMGTYTCQDCGVDGLPPAFIKLCDLDEDSTPSNNPYHSIVRLLTPLLYLKPTKGHFQKLISFGGRTFDLFRPLLHIRDSKALLLLSYWLALLAQTDQWWLDIRARSQCSAIVHYLSTIPDSSIHALLAFPASFGKASLASLWQDFTSNPDLLHGVELS